MLLLIKIGLKCLMLELMLLLQGFEAGGHNGVENNHYVFNSQIKSIVNIPLIAAGV